MGPPPCAWSAWATPLRRAHGCAQVVAEGVKGEAVMAEALVAVANSAADTGERRRA